MGVAALVGSHLHSDVFFFVLRSFFSLCFFSCLHFLGSAKDCVHPKALGTVSLGRGMYRVGAGDLDPSEQGKSDERGVPFKHRKDKVVNDTVTSERQLCLLCEPCVPNRMSLDVWGGGGPAHRNLIQSELEVFGTEPERGKVHVQLVNAALLASHLFFFEKKKNMRPCCRAEAVLSWRRRSLLV